MQYMTDEYHASMAQPIRNKSHIRAEIYKAGGDTISFSEEQIINFSRTDYVSPISETLPTSDMTLTINNRNMEFDPDNEDSPIVQLTKGLQMMVQLGYEIDGDGVITWIPAFYGYLSDWDASDTEAMFTASDRMSQLSMIYPYDNDQYPARELKYLAQDLAVYGGVNDLIIFIDNENLTNALPAVPVSEGLQIVANASGATLESRRNGQIAMVNISGSQVGYIASGTTTYQYAWKEYFLEGEVPTSSRFFYAVQSNGGATVGRSKFAPDDDVNILDGTSFISREVANNSGVFSTPQKIAVGLHNAENMTEIGIQFGDEIPDEVVVTAFGSGNTVIETITIENPSSYCVVRGNFAGVVGYDIEFTKAAPGAAAMVEYVSMFPISDFTITRSMMHSSPKAKRQEKVKNISVTQNSWKTSDVTAYEIYHNEIAMTSGQTLVFSDVFGQPISTNWVDGFTFNITGTGITWNGQIGNYGFEATIEATQDTTAVISCTSKPIEDITSNAVTNYNANGIEVKWDNPLNSGSFSERITGLLKSYYLGSVDYEIEWRGDPCVDVNDRVWLELKDGSKVPIRIYQNELNYNGTLSGVIRARRVVDF